jgi:hypothetical protein
MSAMSIKVTDKCSLAIQALKSLPLTSRQLLHVSTGIHFPCKGVTLDGTIYWAHLAKHLLGERVTDVLHSMLNTYFDHLPKNTTWTEQLGDVIVNTLSGVSSGSCATNRKMSPFFSRYISLYIQCVYEGTSSFPPGPDAAMRRMCTQGWTPVDAGEGKKDARETIGSILRLWLTRASHKSDLLSLMYWLASKVQVGFTRSSLNFAFRKRHILKLPTSLVYYLSVNSPPYVKIMMVSKLKSVVVLANKLVNEASYTTCEFKPYWFFTETHNKKQTVPKTWLSVSEEEYNNRVMCALQQQIKWDRSHNSVCGTSHLLKLISWPAQITGNSVAQSTRQYIIDYILRLTLSQQPIQYNLGFSVEVFSHTNVPKCDHDMASINLATLHPLGCGLPSTFCTECTSAKNIQRAHRQSSSFLKYLKHAPHTVLLDLCVTIGNSLLNEWSSKQFIYCQGAMWYLLDCIVLCLPAPCTSAEKQRHSEVLYLLVVCSVLLDHQDCVYYLYSVQHFIKTCPIELLKQEYQWLNVAKWFDSSKEIPVALRTKCTLLRLLCSYPGNLNTRVLFEETVSCIGMPSDDVCLTKGNPLCFTVCEFGSNVYHTKWVVQMLKILLHKTSVDLAWRSSSGQTLLHCALQTQNVSLARFMIESRPTPSVDLELFNVAGQSITAIIQAIGINTWTDQRRRQKYKKRKGVPNTLQIEPQRGHIYTQTTDKVS